MTAKDYIYLGLLAFSAIAFYWVGFYGGFNTTLKMLETKPDGSRDEDFEKAAGTPSLTGAVIAKAAAPTRIPEVKSAVPGVASHRQFSLDLPLGWPQNRHPASGSESSFGRN